MPVVTLSSIGHRPSRMRPKPAGIAKQAATATMSFRRAVHPRQPETVAGSARSERTVMTRTRRQPPGGRDSIATRPPPPLPGDEGAGLPHPVVHLLARRGLRNDPVPCIDEDEPFVKLSLLDG